MVSAVQLGSADMQELGVANEAWGPQFVDATPSLAGPSAVFVFPVAWDECTLAPRVATWGALPQESVQLNRHRLELNERE